MALVKKKIVTRNIDKAYHRMMIQLVQSTFNEKMKHLKDNNMELLVFLQFKQGNMDRIGMRRSKKPCAAIAWDGWRHAVSKFRRTVSMKIAVEKRYRCNIASVT